MRSPEGISEIPPDNPPYPSEVLYVNRLIQPQLFLEDVISRRVVTSLLSSQHYRHRIPWGQVYQEENNQGDKNKDGKKLN
jgi:hypothetical protein